MKIIKKLESRARDSKAEYCVECFTTTREKILKIIESNVVEINDSRELTTLNEAAAILAYASSDGDRVYDMFKRIFIRLGLLGVKGIPDLPTRIKIAAILVDKEVNDQF